MKTKAVIAVLAALDLFFPHHKSFGGVEFSGIRIGNTQARAIAMDPSITGKYSIGKCLPFAKALDAKLRAAGIASRIVGYSYDSAGSSQLRGHAVVVYNDGGRTYVMDNQSMSPVWVKDAAIHAEVGQFSGVQMHVASAWTLSPRFSGVSEKAYAGLSASKAKAGQAVFHSAHRGNQG